MDPDRGHLYVVWHQRRGGNDEERAPAHVYLSRSTDWGETWEERENLTAGEGPARSNHYHPGISVAPNGRVDVAWYDYRHSPGLDPDAPDDTMGTVKTENFWDIYLTSSADGGESWSPGTRATDRSIDATRGVTFANYDLIGPLGVAATDRATILTWGDTRAGNATADAEDAYFTQVRHPASGDVALTGGTAPAGLSLTSLALGAGAALVVAGFVLIAALRVTRQKATRT